MQRAVGWYTTSHLSTHDSRKRGSHFQRDMVNFTRCNSYSGLCVMPEYHDRYSLKQIQKPPRKINQVEQFALDLELSNDTEMACILGSNDWKTLLSKLGGLLEISNTKITEWGNLSPKAKCDYNAFKEKPLGKEGRLHLNEQLEKYGDILAKILKRSKVEKLYHSSVLERIDKTYPHLDLLFTILNSYLHKKLDSWTKTQKFKNRNGKPIECKFISVQKLFFYEKDPKCLFLSEEQEKYEKYEELTHRKCECIVEVINIIKEEIGM